MEKYLEDLHLLVSRLKIFLEQLSIQFLSCFVPITLGFYWMARDLSVFLGSIPSRIIILTPPLWSSTVNSLILKILAHRQILMPVTLIVIAVFILFRLVNWIRHFKAYLKRLRFSLNIIKQAITKLFQRSFYLETARKIDHLLTSIMVNLLKSVWDSVKHIPIVSEPDQIKKLLGRIFFRIKKYWEPLFRNINRLLRGLKKKDTTLNTAKLLENAGSLEVSTPVHEELLTLFEKDSDEVLNTEWVAETVDLAFSRWDRSIRSGLLITGRPGSGKSRLLKSIGSKFVKDRVNTYLSLEKSDPQGQLSAVHQSLQSSLAKDNAYRTVLYVDNLENLFAQVEGGFGGLQELIKIIAETRPYVFWIIVCNNVFYQYYSHINPFFTSFPDIIDLNQMNWKDTYRIMQEKMKNLIYDFQYVPDKRLYKEMQALIRQKKWSQGNVQQYYREEFTRRIFEIAGHNLSFYHFYFIQSINMVKGKEIHVNMPQFLNYQNIRELSKEDLFILQAAFVHHFVEIEELAAILNLSIAEVDMRILPLIDKNLLKQKAKQYTINQALYPQLLKILKEKNLLSFFESGGV